LPSQVDQLRSARARRVEVRPVVAVSLAVDDELFMLEPLELMPLPVVPLLLVDESVVLPEFVVALPVVAEPVPLRELVVPVAVVDPMLPDGPERTTPPGVVVVGEPVAELPIEPDDELGFVFAAPTPGEPDVPPVALLPDVPEVPDVPVPLLEPVPVLPVPDDCASAKLPPHVSATAAARVRILGVCFIDVSCG